MRVMGLAAALALAGCATVPAERAGGPGGPVEVQLIALNDFHGNLEPPKSAIDHPAPGEGAVQVPAGGAAYLASAVASLRARSPNTMVVAAGDLIGASPLVSALFLDEPTVATLNMIGLDYTALGNHEFDRGTAELLRMQKGGCAVYTSRKPCALEPFAGARFGYLAANVETAGGGTLFPAYAIRSFGEGARQVKVAVIGMPLKETPTMVAGTATAGLQFRDEAETVNALVPRLKAEGADAIVLLIHQGVDNKLGYNDQSCTLTGDLLPILERLDPAVDVVVSGHTHEAYVCDYSRINPSRNFLLTSAGRYGTLLTDITLSIDPVAGRVVAKHANNIIVQSEAFRGAKGDVPLSNAVPAYPADAKIAALVARYAAAAGPVAARPVGRLAGPALRTVDSNHESVLGNLIADAQLKAGRSAGAQVALMNSGGIRADLVPGDGGSLGFGQLFAAQPFANTVVVKSLTGKQLRAVLEQQFASATNTAEAPNVLSPSQGLRFAYDLSKPAGQRIVLLTIGGAPVKDDAVYRVATNSFLAGGGDNFTIFREGTDSATVGSDLDALEAYIAAASTLPLPALGRVENRTPAS